MVICELPHQLLPNLSEVQRMDFVTSARTYQVFNCSPDEPGAFLVTKGEENFKIFSKSIPIICKCMYGKNNISICVHILAIDIKFPDFKIVDQIVKYLEEESEAQRIKRITDQKDGNKQSSSRRTGSKVTRNRKRRIDEIVDTTYSPSNSDTLIEEPGPSLLPLAPSFVRHGNDRLPRPPQLIRHQISHITVIQPASQPIRQPIANRIQRPIRQPIPQSIAQPIPQPIAQPIPRHLVSKQRRADNNPHTTEKEEVREALK
uniref:SWIM-type domain-containing protein n=1 Tax=Panagrolaimus davidi TaxID=227884 RepID=A0A914Q7D7_9BILA